MNPLRGLRHALGGRRALTLALDALFWGCLVAAPFVPFAIWGVLAGAVAVLGSVTGLAASGLHGARIGTSLGMTAPAPAGSTAAPSAGDASDPTVLAPRTARLPALWFLFVLVAPATGLAAVHAGLWSVDPGARLRFRLGVTALVVLLGLGTSGTQVDRYLAASGLASVEEDARGYLRDSLKKASVTLLAARGLDGVISVLESFSLSAVAGVSPGEILEPVDDLVERFSFVMLLATASLTAQLILLEVGSALGLTFFLSAALVILLIGLWIPHRGFAARLYDLAYKLSLLAIVIRIGIPAAAAAGEGISARFLAAPYAASSSALEATADDLRLEADAVVGAPARPAGAAPDEEAKSFWRRLTEVTGAVATVSLSDVRARLAQLEAKLAQLSEHVVRLLAIFVLEAMVFPLLVAWGLSKLLAILAGGPREATRPTG